MVLFTTDTQQHVRCIELNKLSQRESGGNEEEIVISTIQTHPQKETCESPQCSSPLLPFPHSPPRASDSTESG